MRILGIDITRSPSPTPADLMIAEQSRKAELRSKTLSEQGWESVGGVQTHAGMRITEEGSLRLAAVYACVRYISESIASLPLKVYRREDRARYPERDHSLYTVLHDQANTVMTAMDYRDVMLWHLLLWGNSYSEIVRTPGGDVVELWPIHPGRVSPKVKKAKNGRIELEYHILIDGRYEPFPATKIFHVRGPGTSGLVGKSPIRLHRETLGIDSAAQRFGANFFSQDARTGVYISTERSIGDEEYERIRKEWVEQTGPGEAFKTKILEGGLKAATLGLPPADAQFIETRKYSRSEIAAIFRVQPHKIGDLEKATYSNIEQQAIESVTDTLRPWMVRIEQAASMQLLTATERRQNFVSHVVDGLLRGDTKSRYDAYALARSWGWLSANDILELENRNPIEGGDVYLQPLNMIEAGRDPMEAGNSDVDFDERSVRRLPQDAERRALPSRYSTAKALETVYLDQMRRIVKREAVEIRRNLDELRNGNPEAFGRWLVEFEDEHAEWMADRTRPMFRAMAEAMVAAADEEVGDGDGESVAISDIEQFVEQYIRTHSQRYTGSSRGQLLELSRRETGDDEPTPADLVEERLDDWEAQRAEKEARRERQRSSNAFTKAAWAVVGVATLTWRNVGSDNCPICEEMDGMTATITSTFAEPGDSVADLDVSSRITHPPIHDGCDCILMPGTTLRKALSAAELRSLFDSLLHEVPAPHFHTNGQIHA